LSRLSGFRGITTTHGNFIFGIAATHTVMAENLVSPEPPGTDILFSGIAATHTVMDENLVSPEPPGTVINYFRNYHYAR